MIKRGGQLHGVPSEYIEIIDDVFALKLKLQFGCSKNEETLSETMEVGVLAYQSAENKYEAEMRRNKG